MTIVYSRIIGVPDLVVEVISPGTRLHDWRRKFATYAHAGISKYWLVDPQERTIEIFTLEEGVYRSSGAFRGRESLRSRVVAGMAEVYARQCFAPTVSPEQYGI